MQAIPVPVAGVREAIEAAGARLKSLPPYSPDFNPVQNMWSKIKQSLRRQSPRTHGKRLAAATTAFAAIAPADSHSFFLHASYAT